VDDLSSGDDLMTTNVRRGSTLAALALFLTLGSTGCASLNETERGAVIGAAAGGAVGGVVGNQTGSTARGAIIGAVLGGAAGAVIGRQMDEKADELEEDLEGAEVERVGEGILVTFDSGILFDFDSSALRPEARENLSELASTLGQQQDDYELLVAGHTDSRGTDEYNQRLSERRAAAAANYLIGQGVPPARINQVGLGESEPVATNETEYGRQQNRRVEVAIYASEEYQRELRERYGN
jgi:outer membrane protein OmpA-like peptidoglycan-associated protein